MICSNCAQPISEGIKFCTGCGAAVGATTPPPPPSQPFAHYSSKALPTAQPQQPRKANAGKLAALAIVGVVFVCLSVFAFILYDAHVTRTRNIAQSTSTASDNAAPRTFAPSPMDPSREASAAPEACAVPSISSEYEILNPPRPDNGVRDSSTLISFNPDTAVGSRFNNLLLQMNVARNNFLSNNEHAEEGYKRAYVDASDGNVDAAHSEQEFAQRAGNSADASKSELKNLAEQFANAWSGLDGCYRRQFADKIIWPTSEQEQWPDVFVSVDAQGSLRGISAHGANAGDYPVSIYPWKW